MVCVVLFRRSTSYEMRISDWSSGVCSSDLMRMRGVLLIGRLALAGGEQASASMPITAASRSELAVVNNKVNDLTAKVEELEKNMPSLEDRVHEIGRAHV